MEKQNVISAAAVTERPGAGALPVSALVAETVARIDPAASLLDVADAMSAAEVGALVVGDCDDVGAIVSERDLVHALATRQDPATTTAGEIAHTNLVWCDVDASVAEVALKMMGEYVRHVLVDDDGRLAGIVSARDILGAYAAADTARLIEDDW
jgi:signal-transduction protein with cAMP-binding, CBS, and nucleotidyltransferase domain